MNKKIISIAILMYLVIMCIMVNNVSVEDDIAKATELTAGVTSEVANDLTIEDIPEVVECTPEPVEAPIREPEVERYIYYDIPLDNSLQREIADIANEYGFDYELILSIMYVESGYKANTIGDHGDSYGLMQVQPKWCKSIINDLGVTNLLDPISNTRVGCAVLRDIIERNNCDIYSALRRYNTGNAKSSAGIRYADKVLDYKRKLKEAN